MNTKHKTYRRSFITKYRGTYQSRVTIGFKKRDTWRAAPAHFTKHSLLIHDHPVMEDWEEGYMAALAEVATRNCGTVLEIGFGMGISAECIQEHPIEQHIVIEANEGVASRLFDFAEYARSPVTPMVGFWEDETKKIPSGSIDGILFDTYPLSEEELHKNHFFFFKEAFRLLRPGGMLTYYSDEAKDFGEGLQILILHYVQLVHPKIVRIGKTIRCSYR
jgi:guanidinoacetate N-methyltransferase